MTMKINDNEYLQVLAEKYPTTEAVMNRIIELSATLHLPKSTEYYFSDLHGEHEAFIHLLRSGSGVIREKIDSLFHNTLMEHERAALAGLIYYPEEQLARTRHTTENFDDWCAIRINQLVVVCREVSAKYTRSRVRRAMDPRYASTIEELMNTDGADADKLRYFTAMVSTAIQVGAAQPLICALCQLIQRMTVDQLHIIGDIFDRGPRADHIIDELIGYPDVDIQWGNHDISWIGAMAGNPVCLMSVLRIAISYNSFDVLEDGYGINLRPLSMFAAMTYATDHCDYFMPHVLDENEYDPVDPMLAAKMNKAVTIMLFKLEGQLLQRHPEYHMEHRLLLDKVDFAAGTITIDGNVYSMNDCNLPTVDPADPYRLSEEEEALVDGFLASFRHSSTLRRHMDFIMGVGSMYLVKNDKLLFHGCMPMNDDGTFAILHHGGQPRSGKIMMDYLDQQVRLAYYTGDPDAVDLLWYLWCGAKSPLFGKDRMTTFERVFISDKSLQAEGMSAYYHYCEDPAVCARILREFDIDPAVGHIVNGHVPVKQGENPIKANGRLFVIDGGISKAYQSKTGIAGYTLISSSRDIQLAEHTPYCGGDENHCPRMSSTVRVVERMSQRVMVADTYGGKRIAERIEALKQLLARYQTGAFRR